MDTSNLDATIAEYREASVVTQNRPIMVT
jgi:hypothetical protein